MDYYQEQDIKRSADEIRKAQMFIAILHKALAYAPMDSYKKEVGDTMDDVRGYINSRILSMHHNGVNTQRREFAVTIEEVSGSPPDFERGFKYIMENFDVLKTTNPEIHAELNRLGLLNAGT